MLALVCGGASSGKSEYAENLIMKLSGGDEMTYLATMESRSDAAKNRIADHEKRREGRGFSLIECEKNISCVRDNLKKNVLLECLPTLVSNEMFVGIEEGEGKGFIFNANISDRIFGDIIALKDRCENLVIVTNDVFSDGCIYDDMTEAYRQQLGELSCNIAEKADMVVYMTCGIPEVIKNEILDFHIF